MPKKIDLAKIKPISSEEQKALVGKSVTKESAATYDATLRTFGTMIAALRGTTPSSVSILTVQKTEFLSCCDALLNQDLGTASMIVAALKKQAAREGTSLPWLNDPDVKASVTAVTKAAKKKKKPCGVLTEPQFQQLCTHLSETQQEEMLYAVQVATSARLRIGELMLLRHCDFFPSEEVGFVYLRQQKQADEDITPEPKVIPLNLLELVKNMKHKGKTDYLFAPGVDSRLRLGMDEWAQALHWSDALRWSGPHVLRHSGTHLLRQRLQQKIGDAVLQVFAQQSLQTMHFYQQGAEERLKKKRRL